MTGEKGGNDGGEGREWLGRKKGMAGEKGENDGGEKEGGFIARDSRLVAVGISPQGERDKERRRRGDESPRRRRLGFSASASGGAWGMPL